MMAWRPTSLNAIAWALSREVVAMATIRRTRRGNSIAKSRAVMPPIEPPMTACNSEMPRCSSSSFCVFTMSWMVTNGKRRPKGRPVAGSVEAGPVDPWHPPRTLAQTTKNRRVSTALPGPIRLFHQPGLRSSGECQPAQ